LVFSGISQGAQPILSINYGAGLYTRVRETLRLGIKVSLVCGIFFYISLLIFRDPVILLFTRNNPAILEITKVGFPIFFLGSIFTGLNLALGGFFQSIGNGKIASIINIMRGFVLIALGLLILPKLFGVIGIWSAYLVCEVLTFILATVYYKKFFKKKNLSL
ncbi:MAG: MATE family efflux transporter, partial [Cetobacterium sp.]